MKLTIEDARKFASAYFDRRSKFVDEDPTTSLMVAVLNFGDHLTPVACVNGEWTGIKAELLTITDIPKCPNGHVLTESRKQFRLGFVPTEE